MKQKRLPWEEINGPLGPPQADERHPFGAVRMTEEQRVALLRMLHNTFLDLRGMMYADPSASLVTWMAHVGRCLHNVPVWIEEGMIRPNDFAWVMEQAKNNFKVPKAYTDDRENFNEFKAQKET